MPACEVECLKQHGKKRKDVCGGNGSGDGEGDDDKSLVVDSFNKNPWESAAHRAQSDEHSGKDSDSDTDFLSVSNEEESVDNLDGFEEVDFDELQNFMLPYISTYPCGEKLLVVFLLDGDILDIKANNFEFIDGDTAVRRWSRVPKQLESARDLLGLGKNDDSTQVDLVVLEAELKR